VSSIDASLFDFHRFAIQTAWLGVFLALLNAAAVVVERALFAGNDGRVLAGTSPSPLASRRLLSYP
jgi:hypothetical protein